MADLIKPSVLIPGLSFGFTSPRHLSVNLGLRESAT